MVPLIFIAIFAFILNAKKKPYYPPQQFVKLGNYKITYINDDGNSMPISLMFPNSESEKWKLYEELLDEKG